MSTHLVLTGMPGAGKSTVGRIVAERLGRSFVDVDDVVARREGRSAAEIIRQDGEPAFRENERAAVASLSGMRPTVVATGGWTVGDPSSRAVLASLGPIVCLDATPRELAARLAAGDARHRPMLDGAADLERRLRELLDVRRGVYDALPWHVSTSGRDPAAVAEAVLALAEAVADLGVTAVPVRTPHGGYSVLVGAGLLDRLGAVVGARAMAARAAVVSDRDVSPIYGARLSASLERAGIRVCRASMQVGEPAKTLDTVRDLYHALILCNLDRRGLVVALGGGVVCDTAGFAAATYLRGVDVAHVPTSLLAMVDASVGGKTGVNLAAGKNLVGAFHHPALVAADPEALATLPEEHLRQGMAEVVKAAVIGGGGLFEQLEADGIPDRSDTGAWSDLIVQAVAIKAAIVSRDPMENGERARLNLGHTFGHAIEASSSFAIGHGDAVAIGLVGACLLAEGTGRADGDLGARIERLHRSLGLPTRCPGLAPADVLAAMAPDKKRHGGRLRFVLPRSIGDVEIADDVPRSDVAAVLDRLCGAGAEPVDQG